LSPPASWARSRGVATCKWRQQVTLLAYAYAHASPMLYRLSLDLQSDLTYRLNLPTLLSVSALNLQVHTHLGRHAYACFPYPCPIRPYHLLVSQISV